MAFKREVQSPSRKRLKLIKVKKIPKNTGNIVEACVEIYDGKDYTPIWTDNPNFKYEKYNMRKPSSFAPQTPVDARTDKQFSILVPGPHDRGLELSGDVFFKLVNVRSGQLICRFALNTAFMTPRVKYLPNKNKMIYYYELNKRGVDPDSIAKNPKFDPDFKVQLFFEDVCVKCHPKNPLSQLCKECRRAMKGEVEDWVKIGKFLTRHEELSNERQMKMLQRLQKTMVQQAEEQGFRG